MASKGYFTIFVLCYFALFDVWFNMCALLRHSPGLHHTLQIYALAHS